VAQLLSEIEVGATDWYCVLEQAVKASQIESLVVAVGLVAYVELGHTNLSVQPRSENAVADVLWYSTAEQIESAEHALSDVNVSLVEAYCTSEQMEDTSAHTRSEDSVGCAVRYCALVQVLMRVHVRSEAAVFAIDSNSVEKSHTVRSMQTRSELVVCAVDSYCQSALQSVICLHTGGLS
jgi:hypothetical protein